MHRLSLFAIAVISSICLCAQSRTDRDLLSSQIETEITSRVLPYWLQNAPDGHGGFCGVITADGQGVASAPRGAVLAGRLVWTFSAAYRMYGILSYLDMANQMQRYYIDNFIDKTHGGAFWSIDADSRPLDCTKQAYASAFGIYGLSEHFRATGDNESLDRAIDLYNTLSAKMLDPVNGGYREAMTRDFSHSAGEGVDGRDDASKTMNTHIHLLEAFTNLYRVWPEPRLAADIRALIYILSHQLYNPDTAHLVIFCSDDWRPLAQIESYGHDIETSWLLSEAAEVLGDSDLIAAIHRQAVAMTDAALRDGADTDGGICYEKSERGINHNKAWWVHCEAVIGCLNAWQITGDERYFRRAQQLWQYISDKFVDPDRGEWFHNTDQQGTPMAREPKGSMWNCPYHNSRLAFEAVERLRHHGPHTEVMAWSNITGIRLNGQLIDMETSLAVGTIGGEMEHTGRERQNNVRYRREGLTQIVDIPTHGAHFHQEVTDNDSSGADILITATADTTLSEGAYWCVALPARHYADARILAKGKRITIDAPDRHLALLLDRPVKTHISEAPSGDKELYLTLLPRLSAGATASLRVKMQIPQAPAALPSSAERVSTIAIDASHPGNKFLGFGGNFRIQNPTNDPKVIDYCLRDMRVAMGRVEMPWAAWDAQGADHPHVRASAHMAQRLKAQGMPVIVSCWFPPQWALAPGSVRQRGGVAALRLDPAKTDSIYDQLASYLLYLKNDMGVEADFFSFNESDIGIDVLHTPQEHCQFIKDFGSKLVSAGLSTKLLLGDNSDATTMSFIAPAMADTEALKYIGAVSFHSWRGCDDATLRWWHDAAARCGVPLIVGEGSTDAAAWRYPQVFRESTFALYEINLYTRLCNICQPASILQWQLTADYSPMQGEGILGVDGPLRPTQRYYNLKQLAMTPEAFAIPVTTDNDDLTVAAMYNRATASGAIHIVNNGATCPVTITGIPTPSPFASAAQQTYVTTYTTTPHTHAEATRLPITDGTLTITLAPESFTTILLK